VAQFSLSEVAQFSMSLDRLAFSKRCAIPRCPPCQTSTARSWDGSSQPSWAPLACW
jgi:hypothetical protein